MRLNGRNGPRTPQMSTGPKTKDREEKTEKTAQNCKKERPGHQMLKYQPRPPPGPISTGMSKIGPPATKLCQKQTKFDKVRQSVAKNQITDQMANKLGERQPSTTGQTPKPPTHTALGNCNCRFHAKIHTNTQTRAERTRYGATQEYVYPPRHPRSN
ncbi:hypothetical protein J6590_096128 [Homalodisca vitripennis]|nr:hypothetical protein J6590_096128 [Homalodisca vitripennis]